MGTAPEPLLALVRIALGAFLAGALGCGPSPRDRAAEDPIRFLRVGVDPASEAESSILDLARAGYLLETRLDGRAFVAVGARRRRDGASVVRVFTTRGTVAALDAPDPRAGDRRRVALRPARAPFELDGGPGEEIAIEVQLGERRCVALLRVGEDGAAAEVPLPLAELPGAPCAERLADVAGDRRLEVLAEPRFDVPGLPTASVPIALGAEGGQYRALPPALARAFYAPERRVREEAGRSAEPAERVRLAVELAAIARLEGRASEEVFATFDRAVSGVTGVDEAASAARAYVRAGLGLGSGFARAAVLDGPP